MILFVLSGLRGHQSVYTKTCRYMLQTGFLAIDVIPSEIRQPDEKHRPAGRRLLPAEQDCMFFGATLYIEHLLGDKTAALVNLRNNLESERSWGH